MCFFRPAGRFRDGLARQISAPLASDDGEPTGDPSVASLALAPWPARRALKVEKIESVSRDTPPAPRCRAGDVKPALGNSYPRKKIIQSIPYFFAMKRDLLREIRFFLCPASPALTHAHVKREARATRPPAETGELTTLLGPDAASLASSRARCQMGGSW